MPAPKLRIDREHTLRLLAGQAVTVKVPPGAKTLAFQLDKKTIENGGDSMAKILDVFFNGRPA